MTTTADLIVKLRWLAPFNSNIGPLADQIASRLAELEGERDRLSAKLAGLLSTGNVDVDRCWDAGYEQGAADNVRDNASVALLTIRAETAEQSLAEAKALLGRAADFIEDEADNRASAGSEMSDYEREPRSLVNDLDAFLAGGGEK